MRSNFIQACQEGNLEEAQRLYSLGGVNIHTRDEEAFRRACWKGHLTVAQWLYSLGEVDIHILNEWAFRFACADGHLALAQWLYSLGEVDIHMENEEAFRRACWKGHLTVAQWLISLYPSYLANGEVKIDQELIDNLAQKYGCYPELSLIPANLQVNFEYYRNLEDEDVPIEWREKWNSWWREKNIELLKELDPIFSKDFLLNSQNWSGKRWLSYLHQAVEYQPGGRGCREARKHFEEIR